MRSFTSFLIIISCCLTAIPVYGRKKEKHQNKENVILAMIEPDAMVAPSLSHPAVMPVEEAYRHHINKNEHRYGIDVSRYQGNINWQMVKTDKNVSYVYLKATEGASLVDVTYRYNLNEARKAGLKVGCYHFFSPTVDAETQFKNFTSTVNLDEQDLIPIIDVEIIGRTNSKRFCERLTHFLRMVEEHYGLKPIIYTSNNFYNKYLAGKYTEYKYMIARYRDEVPELTDDIKFVMWQFTANGRINGINGPVDRSRFMDNYHLGDILINK
ncbi:GH25 family lysozyme [Phocaeicola sartorii]|uniref:glycoside hydrolase family 25 protein n=1 Tax=Phocaeicola sartorii TaxID=671267 RepID=UPI002584CF86|nr:GH25 family lysozyme [Phocaeicola sartorii]